jgi:cation:H+ antiporter
MMCVLGLTGIVTPGGIPVGEEAITQDLPVMVLVALACLPVFFISHSIERWEGFVLLGFYGLYTTALICEAQHQTDMLRLVTQIAWVAGPLTVAGYSWSILQQVRNLRG